MSAESVLRGYASTVALGAALLVSAAASGQQPGQVDLAPLKNLAEPPNAQQRSQIEQWLRDNLGELIQAAVRLSNPQQPAEGETVPDLSAIRQRIIAAGKGSEAFSAAFVEALGQQVLQATKGADSLVALNLTIVLAQMEHPSAADALLDLVKNKNPAVQYWALKGLAAIRQQVLTGEGAGNVIASLVQVGSQTHASVVLRQIYRLLDMPNNPAADTAVIEILESRLGDYLQRKARAMDADVTAVQLCQGIYGRSGPEQQRRILTVLAGMLKSVVSQYATTNPVPPIQYHLELVALQIDQTLARITGTGNQALSQALRQRDMEKVMEELTAWVGSDETQGVLNKPPYAISVPQPGSGAPAPTTTAPAEAEQPPEAER